MLSLSRPKMSSDPYYLLIIGLTVGLDVALLVFLYLATCRLPDVRQSPIYYVCVGLVLLFPIYWLVVRLMFFFLPPAM